MRKKARLAMLLVLGNVSLGLQRSAMACEAPLILNKEESAAENSYRLAAADAFSQALSDHAHPLFLKMRTTEELSLILAAGGKLFLNQDHTAGFGVTADGELISLFNDTGVRGWGAVALLLARRQGMRYLHCLEPLQAYYEAFGFRVEARSEATAMDADRYFQWSRLGQPITARLRMVLDKAK